MRATPLQDAFTSVWGPPPAPLTPAHYPPSHPSSAIHQMPSQTPTPNYPSRTVRVMDADSTRQLIRDELASLADRQPSNLQSNLTPALYVQSPVAPTAAAPAPAAAPTFSWSTAGLIAGLVLAVVAVVLLAVLVSNTISIKTVMLLNPRRTVRSRR
jgi:hypothetical protein